MKLTNEQVFKINIGLSNLMHIKMGGRLKFIIYKNKKEIEKALTLYQDTIKDLEEEKDKNEVANMVVEVEIQKIKTSDFDSLEVEPMTFFYIDELIEDEE